MAGYGPGHADGAPAAGELMCAVKVTGDGFCTSSALALAAYSHLISAHPSPILLKNVLDAFNYFYDQSFDQNDLVSLLHRKQAFSSRQDVELLLGPVMSCLIYAAEKLNTPVDATGEHTMQTADLRFPEKSFATTKTYIAVEPSNTFYKTGLLLDLDIKLAFRSTDRTDNALANMNKGKGNIFYKDPVGIFRKDGKAAPKAIMFHNGKQGDAAHWNLILPASSYRSLSSLSRDEAHSAYKNATCVDCMSYEKRQNFVTQQALQDFAQTCARRNPDAYGPHHHAAPAKTLLDEDIGREDTHSPNRVLFESLGTQINTVVNDALSRIYPAMDNLPRTTVNNIEGIIAAALNAVADLSIEDLKNKMNQNVFNQKLAEVKEIIRDAEVQIRPFVAHPSTPFRAAHSCAMEADGPGNTRFDFRIPAF